MKKTSKPSLLRFVLICMALILFNAGMFIFSAIVEAERYSSEKEATATTSEETSHIAQETSTKADYVPPSEGSLYKSNYEQETVTKEEPKLNTFKSSLQLDELTDQRINKDFEDNIATYFSNKSRNLWTVAKARGIDEAYDGGLLLYEWFMPEYGTDYNEVDKNRESITVSVESISCVADYTCVLKSNNNDNKMYRIYEIHICDDIVVDGYTGYMYEVIRNVKINPDNSIYLDSKNIAFNNHWYYDWIDVYNDVVNANRADYDIDEILYTEE